ncbi:reverse transcriptase domain-containing protein [Tanacetum coccineum]
MVSPFLCSDDSGSDTEMLERQVSPTTSTLEIPTAPILPAPSAVIAPSSEFPLALYSSGRICRALNARKSVRPLSSHRLALRYTLHHLDHFTSGSFIRPSSSIHSALGIYLGHSLPGNASPDTTIVINLQHHLLGIHVICWTISLWSCRPMCYRDFIYPSYSAFGSILVADLLPPRKRFRDSISPEDSVEEDIDTDVLEDIEADATADEVAVDRDVEAGVDAGIGMEVDVGVDVEDEVEDEVESSDRGTMEVGVDVVAGIDIPDGMLMPDAVEHLEQVEEGLQDIYEHVIEIPLQRIEDIKTGQRELEARSLIDGGERASLLEQVASLERSNARLRGTMMMERARADRFRRRVSFMESELRQIRRFRYYDRMRFRRLETFANMTITRSGMTPEAIKELINRRVEEALAAYKATRAANALEAESQSQNGSDGDNGNGGNGNGGDGNGGDGNGENGNGRNGNPNENNRGARHVARECTYQDFMKCQPLNFKGTEGVVGLIRWFEKMETVFHISNCLEKYQVKELMKLMAKVYCPRNEIQKLESELWNLTVKNNNLAAYTQRFQELTMMCTKMVPEEEDQVDKFIGGLPDNMQGNVIAAEPTRLQDVVRIANNLIDQKLKGYAVKNDENKRRAYTAGNNEKRGYAGPLPYCNKCKLHHEGPCTVKCGKCNKVAHMARDCKESSFVPTLREPCSDCMYGYSSKRTKMKQNGQNRAREWKECKKSKPKAYTSLMG